MKRKAKAKNKKKVVVKQSPMSAALIEYDVVDGEDLDEFIAEVNKAISEGWVPLGGIATAETAHGPFYYQAVAKQYVSA